MSKSTCPICFKQETREEIRDCQSARRWAREAIRFAEGAADQNKYDAWGVARPRGANGQEAY